MPLKQLAVITSAIQMHNIKLSNLIIYDHKRKNEHSTNLLLLLLFSKLYLINLTTGPLYSRSATARHLPRGSC